MADRIRRAAAAGQISCPDRDIRLGNVRSAQSMWELDPITRELDQLDQLDQLDTVASPVPQGTSASFTPGAALAAHGEQSTRMARAARADNAVASPTRTPPPWRVRRKGLALVSQRETVYPPSTAAPARISCRYAASMPSRRVRHPRAISTPTS